MQHVLKQIAIAANPYSGRGGNRQHIDALVDALRDAGFMSVPMWEPGALTEALADTNFVEQYHSIIAAGGDGTLAYVVNLRPPVPVTMYPLGNENLFARQFGYRRDPQHMADIIAHGVRRRIDLGNAGGRLFTLVASAGFDGRVAHDLTAWRQRKDHLRRVGRLTYVRPMLGALIRYDFPVMKVTADDRTMTGCLAMVFNTPQYGLNLPLAPDADPADGLLDYVVFEHPGVCRLGGYALSVMMHRHTKRPDVHCGQAKHIVIAAESPVPLETDGEAADFAPVDIHVEPASLQVLTHT